MSISPQDIEQASKNLTDWKTGFFGALAAFVEKRIGMTGITVTSFEDEAEGQGGCTTCYGGLDYTVTIWYNLPNAKYVSYYEYSGRFSELLNELVGA